MKLRTQLFLFLFAFGLAPMVAIIAVNLPPVMAWMERYLHRAQLQNFRTDFVDLDQYLASRKEMVRFLAKLPPRELLASPSSGPEIMAQEPDEASQEQFLYWVNQILAGGVDLFRVAYYDRNGHELLRLTRDRGGLFEQAVVDPEASPSPYVETGMNLGLDAVSVGPIRLGPSGRNKPGPRWMTMPIISPIHVGGEQPHGVVIAHIDLGGLPSAHSNTLWVHNNGEYLVPRIMGPGLSAFDDFPGLRDLFRLEGLSLWHGRDGAQVIWVPLFSTEVSGPLWVGRWVDPTSIDRFQDSMRNRTVILVLALIVFVIVVARWLAVRAETLGKELTQGVARMLADEGEVAFSWHGPKELRVLSKELSLLGKSYARKSRTLQTRTRQLEESSRYKSEFLANVSHELRTPLNSILLLSKLLAENNGGRLSDEQVRHAHVVHSAGSSLLDMIDDILEVSKIDAHKIQFRITKMELPSLWDSLLEVLSPLAQEKGLSVIRVGFEDVTEAFYSDEEKVRRILENFLSNAVKFTEKGSITVGIAANTREDAQQRPLCLYVQDAGIGIPADKQDSVFEAFKQVDGSSRRRYGGTGLGLAISTQMATLLGGRITLESQLGVGSTFSLLLPWHFDSGAIDPELIQYTDAPRVDGQESNAMASKDALLEETTADYCENETLFHGERILFADGDIHSLLALTPLLTQWGLQVTGAGDPEEASEALEYESDFQGMLLEEQIAQVLLKENPSLANIPGLLILTNTGANGPAQLRKPVDPKVLCSLLKKQLATASAL